MQTGIGEAPTVARYTQLAAHLETLPLLTGTHFAQYNALRGYVNDPALAR